MRESGFFAFESAEKWPRRLLTAGKTRTLYHFKSTVVFSSASSRLPLYSRFWPPRVDDEPPLVCPLRWHLPPFRPSHDDACLSVSLVTTALRLARLVAAIRRGRRRKEGNALNHGLIRLSGAKERARIANESCALWDGRRRFPFWKLADRPPAASTCGRQSHERPISTPLAVHPALDEGKRDTRARGMRSRRRTRGKGNYARACGRKALQPVPQRVPSSPTPASAGEGGRKANGGAEEHQEKGTALGQPSPRLAVLELCERAPGIR